MVKNAFLKIIWPASIIFFGIFILSVRGAVADTASNQLRIGIYDNPPKLFIEKNNQPKGIFPGIIDAIAQKEGWQIKFIPLSFKDGLKRLENGTLDIMQDVAWSEKRSRLYSFTNETVMVSWGRVYQKNGQGISTLIDLKNKRIAYMDGGIYSDGPDGLKTLMKKFELDADFIPVDNYKQVFEYIHGDKADAGIVNRLFGRTNKHQYDIENTPILISPISIRLAFSKSNPATPQLIKIIDAHLVRMKSDADSIYYQLIDEYIGEPRKVIPPFLKTLLGFLLLLLAVSALLGFFLNSQSRKKSAQLEARDRELKESESKLLEKEARFKGMASVLPCGIIETDRSFNIIYANRIGLEMLGYNRADFEKRLNCKSFFVSGIPPEIETAFRKSDFDEAEILSTEHQMIKKDGSEISVLLNIIPVTQDQKTVGFRASIADLTEIKKLQRVAIRNQKLESTGILAGGIAHDFNNILLGLFGNIGLAKLELSPEQNAYKLIEEAEKSMAQAKDLTAQLLTFAQGGDPIKQAVTIDQIIKETASFNLSGSSIKFIMEKPKDLWPVNADKSQISQVISNLVINARQAMSAGGNLRVRMENAGLPEKEFSSLELDRYVKISITDEGTGIESSDLEKIFDPYFTTKADGNGLGLSIVHSIILKHRGYIYVSSLPGKGTTFVIYIPAAEPAALTADTEAEKGREDMENRSLSVLLMDDDPLVQEVSKKILKRLGHNVMLCDEGSQAIEEYQAARGKGQPFDMIIMDLTIPGGMGGQETIEKLQQIDPQVAAVVASGYSTDPVMANFKDYGFKAMITKPYTFEKMQQVVNQAISS